MFTVDQEVILGIENIRAAIPLQLRMEFLNENITELLAEWNASIAHKCVF